MKLHLCFAGIMLLVVIAPTTAAETETERLKQAQGLFQPLPRDMATPEAPITPQRVDLGRLLFFDPRLTVDADVSCSSCHQPARNGRAAQVDRCEAATASAPCPDNPQCRAQFHHSLARRPGQP